MSKKRPSPDEVIIDVDEVIDLTFSSGDEENGRGRRLLSTRKRLRLSGTPKIKSESSSRKIKSDPDDPVPFSNEWWALDEPKSDDDDDELFSSSRSKARRAKKKASRRSHDDDDDDDDVDNSAEDEVEVVQRQRQIVPAAAAASTAAANAGGDEVELVGTVNELRLPHARNNCTEKPFQGDEGYSLHMRTVVNKQFCVCCYCYVCDVKAGDCSSWDEHCMATDRGPKREFWIQKRRSLKQSQQPQTAAPFVPLMSSAPRRRDAPRSNRTKNTATLSGSGPFPPTNKAAQRCIELTKCRHCGWFNKFIHKNFDYIRRVESGKLAGTTKPSVKRNQINPTGALDWCHSCGRVASDRDLGKVQSKQFEEDKKENVDSILLGTKTIGFRLRSHDPRKMHEFRQRWLQNEGSEGWNCDLRAMDRELFQHRFGVRPTLEMIHGSISIYKEDRIPEDGNLPNKEFETHDWSVSETEALFIDHKKDRSLLCDLYDVAPNFGKNTTLVSLVDGDITAKWNEKARKGTFTIRVFLKPASSVAAKDSLNGPRRAAMVQFLGSFCDIFPFKLKDLAGLNVAPKVVDKPVYSLKIPPFSLDGVSSKKEKQEHTDAVKKTRKTILRSYNNAVTARKNVLTLKSGSGSSSLGGVCTDEVDFEGVMKRFYREVLSDVVASSGSNGGAKLFYEKRLGVASTHRSLRTNRHHLVSEHAPTGYYSDDDDDDDGGERGMLTSFLSKDGYAYATTDLVEPSKRLLNKTKTLDGLLSHQENLGHASAPHVEGLTVELLPFQKQTLQWALERETMPGGLQACLWPKIPSVEQPGTEVWFNPIIGKWTKKQPHLVRGGFIAEQMGLGKTVISLAMILRNPAPTLPASGSKSSDVPSNPDMSKPFWDPDLNERVASRTIVELPDEAESKKGVPPATTVSKKRGSILSHGTLVVCNVSLVGQWIEEAKSKLSDPGLVYPYHGQNRKRNPKILAQNSIVVTTYETLASDASYHRDKSKSKDYCPPVEQVRWWRVICDESHNLRIRSQKSNSVMDIVADHRWLVSGTPVGTSLMDLKNQLAFIGLQNVNEMFNVFKDSVCRHVNDPNLKSKKKRHQHVPVEAPWIGHYNFLIRTVMMRHSQEMKYRGTDTTLMSLPPKTERTLYIPFNAADRSEYEVLEEEALAFYTELRENSRTKIGKSYLKLTQKLVPLRTACAGGRIPLEDPGNHNDDDEEEEEDEDKPKRPKKVQYSEFAYTSKLNTLIKELESIRDNDPTSKSLIFSQFTSTLQWLQQTLPQHGFQFRTLRGDMSMTQRAKALADFASDPPTTIFLLSTRAGACGINLTQANRVFIMEPMLNPAIEKQAIGRVFRLGQKREVKVTRLVMKNSCETRIVDMLKKKYGKGGGVAAAAVAAAIDESSNSKDDNDGNTEESTEPTANAASAVQVGSISKDKNTLVTEEFDQLFGYEGGGANDNDKKMPAKKKSRRGGTKNRVKKEGKSPYQGGNNGGGNFADI